MSDVTRILARSEPGDPAAAVQLLPLVYEELRKLAAAKRWPRRRTKRRRPCALVHEAYIRLVDTEKAQLTDFLRNQGAILGLRGRAVLG